MFSQNNNEEKKLDWMYKGPGGAVDREEYLLGRSIDKSLDQLNAADKEKSTNPPKNHVEHECIPPSIRDFKKQQLGEQVDLAQKLQEDPLVAIKKQEEESRQKLLQNPVQLKKLQKVLKLKNRKKKNKKKRKQVSSSDSESSDNLNKKLSAKYSKIKNSISLITSEDEELDKMLIHKFKKLKHLLTKEDLDEILYLKNDSNSSEDEKRKYKKYNSSDSDSKPNRKSNEFNKKKYDSSDSDDERQNRKRKPNVQRLKAPIRQSENRRYNDRRQYLDKNKIKSRRDSSNDSSDNSTDKRMPQKYPQEYKHKKYGRESKNEGRGSKSLKKIETKTRRSKSESDSDNFKGRTSYRRNSMNDSDEYEEKMKRKRNFGLVKADGTKIHQDRNKFREDYKRKEDKKEIMEEKQKTNEKYKQQRLTEEEKDRRRREMMKNAEWRNHERERNVQKYREEEKRETKQLDYNPNFLKRELLKSANNSTVESRIKSNINNIQRSGRDMSTHFSRRH